MNPIGSRNGLIYHGEREGWLVAYSQHYDADYVTRSNFRVMARAFGLEAGDPYDGPNADGEDAAIESYGGAFGKGQWLLVRPGSACEAQAAEMLERIEDYPILDDEDASQIEMQDALDAAESFISDRYRLSELPYAAIARAFVSHFMRHGTGEYPCDEYRWPREDDPRVRHALAAAIRAQRKAA